MKTGSASSAKIGIADFSLQKRTPEREFRALRSATNAPRRWIRAAF